MKERKYQQARREHLARLVKEVGGQARLADRMEVSASYISQLLSGHREIGKATARKLEEMFDLGTGALDVPVDEVQELPGYVTDSPTEYQAENWISVPSYFATASAGDGAVNQDEVSVPGGFVFKRASLSKAGLIHRQLSCIFARGSSMEPTISSGDLLLLDHEFGQVTDGEIYAVLWGDELRCKRLFWRPDGTISVRSDNADKSRYPDETVVPDQPGFAVTAQVRWRGGWV